jgi:transcriptional regulator with XRE-family HTH domain
MSDRSEMTSKLQNHSSMRKAYIRSKVCTLVPSQVRALRGRSKQADLAAAAGMHQSRISMLETPGANVTLDTLSAIAAAFHVGLMVKFVPFSEMLRWENAFSQDEFTVTRLENDREFLTGEAATKSETEAFRLPSSLIQQVSSNSSAPPPIQAATMTDPLQVRSFAKVTLPKQAISAMAGG